MSLPVLYSFRRCPYAIRARMAIKYSGLKCELREVVLKNKPEQMLSISPKGTVPVLRLGDQVIDESLDIMRCALQTNDPDNWNVDELKHPLLERNDDYFKTYLDRYKYFDRYTEESQQAYLEKALVFVDELETFMHGASSDGYYLLSPELSAIDVAIFPFARQFAFVNKAAFDALDYPKVQVWLEQLLHSKEFLSVMGKFDPWSSKQENRIHV